MKEQFVTFEIAKTLKKLGANISSIGSYSLDGQFHIQEKFEVDSTNWTLDAPLWQQVFDWFESKNLLVTVAYIPPLKSYQFYVERRADGLHLTSFLKFERQPTRYLSNVLAVETALKQLSDPKIVELLKDLRTMLEHSEPHLPKPIPGK